MGQSSTAHLSSLVLMLAAAAAPAGSFAQTAQLHETTAETAPCSAALLPIKNARIPMEGVLSGGQPTIEQVEAAARLGFRTVINLRTAAETGFEWESETAERLGMRYVQIPIAGAEGLTRDNVERIDAALREAREAGPVLLHCASGNRIGAVLALRAAWLHDVAPAAALGYGRGSGLTQLEGPTRKLLGLPEN